MGGRWGEGDGKGVGERKDRKEGKRVGRGQGNLDTGKGRKQGGKPGEPVGSTRHVMVKYIPGIRKQRKAKGTGDKWDGCIGTE